MSKTSDMFAHVTVKICDKEYQFSCPAEDKNNLMSAADLLDVKMREIRDGGKVVGLDRIAVMAALNLADELVKASATGSELESTARDRVLAMRERVEDALQNGRQLELS